jgi:hypothetical protein
MTSRSVPRLARSGGLSRPLTEEEVREAGAIVQVRPEAVCRGMRPEHRVQGLEQKLAQAHNIIIKLCAAWYRQHEELLAAQQAADEAALTATAAARKDGRRG